MLLSSGLSRIHRCNRRHCLFRKARLHLFSGKDENVEDAEDLDDAADGAVAAEDDVEKYFVSAASFLRASASSVADGYRHKGQSAFLRFSRRGTVEEDEEDEGVAPSSGGSPSLDGNEDCEGR